MDPLANTLLLPLGLGLLGFIEPCSIGASLLFLKSVESNPSRVKLLQAGVFTLTRAMVLAAIGAGAALVGTAFLGFQRAGYIVLGTIYVVLGLLYLAGQAGHLMRTLGPRLGRLSNVRGVAALAVFFGLHVPACAAPLLVAILGSAAVVGGARVGHGFLMLAIFGIALSLPLVLAPAFGPARQVLEKVGIYSRRVPVVFGVLFIALGAWSIHFGWTARWTGG
jgi:cytochrome c-type biogenesis protein